MQNVIYTTTKNDVWASDIEDLIDALNTFWMPYKFQVVDGENDTLDIVAEDSRFEPDNDALSAFDGVCNLIVISIQMWAEGHTVGRFKKKEVSEVGKLFGSSNWHN